MSKKENIKCQNNPNLAENIKCQNNPNLAENLAKDRNKLSNSNSSVSSAKTSPQTNQQIDEGNFKTKEELKVFMEQNYPQFFENFELSEYIASGSSGNVFKGIYKQNKKQVAIKVLKNRYNKEKKDKEKILSRIKQEMDISSKLHNINIMETYAYINKNENCNFCVLEYGKNGDLENFMRHLLKRMIISETAVNYFGKQILEGLEYLHKRCKIVHMDIKPGNILIDAGLSAKIADFSVSCSYAHFEPENLVKFPFVGTGKFMPPEIIEKANMKIKESEKIDIYSLGVTLYCLFYGMYPYKLHEVKGKDYDKILDKIKNEKLEFPEGRKISSLFKDFLIKTLEKDYSKRINLREALNHPWIKASKAIFDEKENLGCLENFLIKLITDGIANFNELIK
jgi:serine/threonine protein kinase